MSAEAPSNVSVGCLGWLRGPNGEESDGVGVFLGAVPEQRLVFTNAFASDWIPASRPVIVPYMTRSSR